MFPPSSAIRLERLYLITYTGIWPQPDEIERVKFGFNISNRQGEMLKSLLSGQKVVLRAQVSGMTKASGRMLATLRTSPGAGQ